MQVAATMLVALTPTRPQSSLYRRRHLTDLFEVLPKLGHALVSRTNEERMSD